MKAFAVIAILCVFIAASAAVQSDSSTQDNPFCYSKASRACAKGNQKNYKDVKSLCNARFGALSKETSVAHILHDLQKYVNTHITRSYEYLMMATHYANYKMNRPGFEKVFRDLADQKWQSALKLIEYITKRGGEMDFTQYSDLSIDDASDGQYELYELQSIAKALDMEKKLTIDANAIHRDAIGKNRSLHDSDLAHFIEEAFTEKHAECIRKLSGYSTDLTGLLNTNDGSLALYLYDEYLQKQ